jgi:hypothetical protein
MVMMFVLVHWKQLLNSEELKMLWQAHKELQRLKQAGYPMQES